MRVNEHRIGLSSAKESIDSKDFLKGVNGLFKESRDSLKGFNGFIQRSQWIL